MCGLSVSKCRFGGTVPYRIARIALMRPAMPAAASRCPTLVFTAPTTSGAVSARPGARSEEHTSELQSLMRTSYAVFCLKHKTLHKNKTANVLIEANSHTTELHETEQTHK